MAEPMRATSSDDSTWIRSGRMVVRELIDEPVKEAVHEAHAEERAATEGSIGSARPTVTTSEGNGDGGGKRRGRKVARLLIPIAGAAGVAYLRRRMKREGSGSEAVTPRTDEARTLSVSEADEPDEHPSDDGGSQYDETGGGSEASPGFGEGDTEESDSSAIDTS